jgi:hypothetical protein
MLLPILALHHVFATLQESINDLEPESENHGIGIGPFCQRVLFIWADFTWPCCCSFL